MKSWVKSLLAAAQRGDKKAKAAAERYIARLEKSNKALSDASISARLDAIEKSGARSAPPASPNWREQLVAGAAAGDRNAISVLRARAAEGDYASMHTLHDMGLPASARVAHDSAMSRALGFDTDDHVVHSRNTTSIKLMTPSQAREHVKKLDARKAAAAGSDR